LPDELGNTIRLESAGGFVLGFAGRGIGAHGRRALTIELVIAMLEPIEVGCEAAGGNPCRQDRDQVSREHQNIPPIWSEAPPLMTPKSTATFRPSLRSEEFGLPTNQRATPAPTAASAENEVMVEV